MISYPSFATLLLTDEDPYVDVDVIHDLALLRLMRREAEVKTTRLCLKPSSFAIYAFPAVSLNIYHRRFGPPMNHVSFLETTFGCKKKNQTVRCEMNWAELCFWNNFKDLSILSFVFFFFSLFTLFISHYLLFFFTLDFFRYAPTYRAYR